jgi:hypothetical protein
MNEAQRTLWNRLRDFEFDESGVHLTFTDRLARDNGWTFEFAERVVEEYRRFILLAATAGHPVTPSEEVDRAWHLHLAYTRSYWDDLCGEVLGFPLHHGPTTGGEAEDAKYADWYERTLRSYEHTFNAPPPSGIWPPPHLRFAPARPAHTGRASGQIVISAAALAALLAGIAALMGLAGALPAIGGVTAAPGWSLALWVIAGVCAVMAFGVWASHRARRWTRADGAGSDAVLWGLDFGGSSGCGSSGCGSSGCGGGGD